MSKNIEIEEMRKRDPFYIANSYDYFLLGTL